MCIAYFSFQGQYSTLNIGPQDFLEIVNVQSDGLPLRFQVNIEEG